MNQRNLIIALALGAFTFALLIAAPQARAAVSTTNGNGVTSLANPPGQEKKDDVKNGKDKPKRSKKNDDKDGDPDDGDAGHGNDDKKKPNDGPAND